MCDLLFLAAFFCGFTTFYFHIDYTNGSSNWEYFWHWKGVKNSINWYMESLIQKTEVNK